MKIFFPIVFLFVFIPAAAQVAIDKTPRDTTLDLLRMTDLSTLLTKPVFTLPLSYALVNAGEVPVPSLYYSFAGTPQSFSWNRQEKIDLTSPLMLQLKDAEKDLPFKITLQGATTAGALYIAYKHIKKYGFK